MEDCLEKWRQALERREMKRNGSRQKQDRIQEDVCPNGREAGRNVRVQGEEAVQVDGFNYSGGRGQPSRPMNRAWERWRIECRQDGVGGDKYQGWLVTEGQQQEWKVRFMRHLWDLR